VPIFYVEHGGKHDRKKTHCENQNKGQYLVLSFLALPVTHLRTNPYRTHPSTGQAGTPLMQSTLFESTLLV
jgi:hypothetical protein